MNRSDDESAIVRPANSNQDHAPASEQGEILETEFVTLDHGDEDTSTRAAPSAVDTEVSEATASAADNMSDTVGDIMVEVDGLAYPETTVAGSLDYLVRRKASREITYIYVIDEDRVLRGVVALRDLLLARPGQTLDEIMRQAPHSFAPDTPLGEAVQSALDTHHRLYPVVDDGGRMVGMIYSWQLFEQLATELSAQTGSTVGLDKEERIRTPVLTALRMRHPWLQVNLLTAFAAAFVVGMFEDTIAQIIVLAVFLPVLAGQSGNTGCQALAITLRGITLGELKDYPIRRLYMKEATLGALNGIGVGVIAAAAMFYYAGMTGADNPTTLALVILLAMTGACICSGIFGVAVPLTLRKLGADPAMASSIFLTTFTDIVGMGLMLALATSMLL